MARFFHLDRGHSLQIGQVITLEGLSLPDNLDRLDRFSAEELRQHAGTLLPNGILKHGYSHLLGMSRDTVIECFFEYVRRTGYSDKPSRFQSVFAFEDCRDLMGFANRIKAVGDIWEIEADATFRADMTWLKDPEPFLLWSYHAESYWQGKPSKTPEWEYLLRPPVTVVGYRGSLELCLQETSVPPPKRL